MNNSAIITPKLKTSIAKVFSLLDILLPFSTILSGAK